MDKKRLLIYAHYYVPDVASTGQIIKELAEGMLDQFDITVICVVPSYSGQIEEKYKSKKFYFENINGVNIVRIRVPEFSRENKKSRIKNIIGYFFGAIIATMKVGAQDYVFSISQPPILGGLLGVWGKWIKRAKYIYNIQDFNPEQTIAVGYSKNRLVLWTMMIFDKFSCKKSNIVITVGNDLVSTMNKRFRNKNVPKTIMINNWVDEKNIYPLPENNDKVVKFKKKYNLDDKFVIMYSGNIGLYYDLENIIKVIAKFNDAITNEGKPVVFAFIGEGAKKKEIVAYKEKNGLKNIVFIPYQDKNEMIYSLNAADVHLCVNAKGIKGVSCPSKYYGIAACGKPVIGVLEKGSEIQMIIEKTKSGLISEPKDYKRLEENIDWFIKNANNRELQSMGERGNQYLLSNFTMDMSIKKYKNAILET